MQDMHKFFTLLLWSTPYTSSLPFPSRCKQILICYLLKIYLFLIVLFLNFRLLYVTNFTTPSEITKMNRAGSFVSFSLGHQNEGKAMVPVQPWIFRDASPLIRVEIWGEKKISYIHHSVATMYSDVFVAVIQWDLLMLGLVFSKEKKKKKSNIGCIWNISCDSCLKHLTRRCSSPVMECNTKGVCWENW